MTGPMQTRLSPRASLYLARQYLSSFFLVFGVFATIIFVIDVIELLRRASGKPDVTFDLVLTMGFLKFPQTALKTLPFAILFGAMLAFWRLNRSSELVALRAAGVSVWQFLAPILIVAGLISVINVTAINPLSTIMVSQYEQLENEHLRRRSSLMATTSSGVWLREVINGQTVLVHGNGSQVDGQQLSLTQVYALIFQDQDAFSGRIDAARAELKQGYWALTDVVITRPEQATERHETFRMATNLSLDRIQESFSSPSSVSFWELPRFFSALEAAGFSSLSHRLHWHSLLAQPLLFCAMILIAAVFSLRHNRRAGILLSVAGGIGTGFVLFFVSDLVLALGHSAAIPAALAAWAPALASSLLGLTALMHFEDG